MATAKTGKLEELTKLATDFVTTQKGLWDHAAWTDFVASVRTKGIDLSEEAQANLGELLEAMKQFYAAAASTESLESAMKTVVNDSVAFVKEHEGVWGHSEWEEFVKTARKSTRDLSEGTTTYLGGVLESIKVFYPFSPAGAVQKRVSAAPRAKPASQPASAVVTKAEKKPGEPKVSTPTKVPTEAKVAARPSPKSADKKDDLTAIGGIGPTLAKKLNGAGIVSFAQLAALSEKDIAQLDEEMKFKGRIKREDWVGQAKELSRH